MGRLTTFGRRIHKLTQMLEEPRAWALHRKGGSPESFLRFDRPWFTDLGIRTVVDIGANTGQFARTVRMVLPEALIYSFEPLPDCFEALRRAFAGDPLFRSFNVALGGAHEVKTFYRNVYSDSSSFRPMLELHRKQFPFTDGPQQELHIQIRPLDCYCESILGGPTPLMVKIDVQGFEDEVIAGGHAVLSRAAIVIAEVSFAPLYSGPPSFDLIYSKMRNLGFSFAGSVDQLIGPIDGAILQADALFVRPA